MADQELESFLESILHANDEDSLQKLEEAILEPLKEEIDLLIIDSIRQFVCSVLARAPRSFWEAPATDSALLHPIDEHGYGGNILHVKRLVRTTMLLAEAQNFDPIEQDTIIAAALLSTATKLMLIGDRYIVDPMYPYTVDRFIQEVIHEEVRGMSNADSRRHSTSLLIDTPDLEAILRLVRCHLGIFSAIPETYPKTMAEWTLHFADLITAKMQYVIDGEDVKEQRWMI